MPPLYVLKQNAKIRIHNRKLRVERDEDGDGTPDPLVEMPLAHVSELVLFGNIGLTTPLVDILLERGIPVTFLSKEGTFRGQLEGPLTPHVALRRNQYRRLEDAAFVLEMASAFVRAKLRHMRALLQRHNREAPDEHVQAAVDRLASALSAVEQKRSLSSLRGLEGAATAAYFGVFRRFFSEEWRFEKRQRRPPPDPVNVLLSFGYTLMAQLAAGAVQTAGLDPFAGFLHETVYNRPAMALDLMEEFRPVVDGVVLWCCRGGQVKPEMFVPGPPERPIVLTDDGRRCLLKAWEQRMSSSFTHPVRQEKLDLRQCLLEQARQVANCIQTGQVGFQDMGFR